MVASMVDSKERVTFRVTPAQAHTWSLCGGFFSARYRSDPPHMDTYAGRLGTSVHELAVAFDHSTGGMRQDLDDLIGHNWRAGRFTAVDEQRALTEAKTLLTTYAALRQAETVEILGSEVFCQTRPRLIEPGYRIILSGRIDRVARRTGGVIELLDLKTGTVLPARDELYNDPATTMYHLLAAERYDAQRIIVAQFSLRTGGRVEVELDSDGVDAGKERLREMVRQLASDHFSLSPSASCAFCPARATCPALLPQDSATERPL